DAAHARLRVLVATRARLLRPSRGLAPQLFAALHPKHSGVCEIIVLQGTEIGAEKRRAGLELGERDGALLGECRACEKRKGERANAAHVTWIDCRSEPCLPSSSIQ